MSLVNLMPFSGLTWYWHWTIHLGFTAWRAKADCFGKSLIPWNPWSDICMKACWFQIGRLGTAKVLAACPGFYQSVNCTIPPKAPGLPGVFQTACNGRDCTCDYVGNDGNHRKYVSMLASSILLDQTYFWPLYEGPGYILSRYWILVGARRCPYSLSSATDHLEAAYSNAREDRNHIIIFDRMFVRLHILFACPFFFFFC